jgi:hypothetical protein
VPASRQSWAAEHAMNRLLLFIIIFGAVLWLIHRLRNRK